MLLLAHLAAVLLAALALWWMRHEYTEKAVPRLEMAFAPVLAVIVATVLLIVSPGKRFELWAAAIVAGLVAGTAAGLMVKVNQDFGRNLIRIARTWDGTGAAALLLALAVIRFVSSNLTERKSGGYGVLAAAATFLAVYLAARFVVVRFYKVPRSIHLDMARGQNPRRTLVH
jgi:hypothetical protein